MRTLIVRENMILVLGRQGENEALRAVWPNIVTDWAALYGDGVFQLAVKRPGDTLPYPVTVTAEDGGLVWVPTNADTALVGTGLLELTYTVGERVAKSRTWSTQVYPSLTGEGSEEPPEPYESWLDKILATASAAQAAQGKAESAEKAAEQSAAEAAASAKSAAASETAAETSEQNAAASETAAKAAQSAAESAKQQAGSSASAAAGSAAQAAASAKDAQTAKSGAEAAQSKAEIAQAAAEAAETAAQTAQVVALSAQSAAETAQGKAEAAQSDAEAAAAGAALSEANAEGYAQAAAGSASSANGSAGAAATAKADAETAKNAAQTAQTGAETAQGKAEDAQSAAETAQSNAQTAQTGAETAAATATTKAGEAAVSATDCTNAQQDIQDSIDGVAQEATAQEIGGDLDEILTLLRQITGYHKMGTYELIETITVSEAVGSIERTQEPDGTSYKFSSIGIVVQSEISSANSGLQFLGSYKNTRTQAAFINGVFNTSGKRYGYCRLYQDYGVWMADGSAAVNGFSYVVAQTTGYAVSSAYNSHVSDLPYTDAIKMLPNIDNVTIPAGTIIQIYGVRT